MLTSARRVLADRWLWIGATIAALVALPNVIWQIANGWPSLEFYRNARLLKNQPPPHSLLDQGLVMGPLSVPVWLATPIQTRCANSSTKCGKGAACGALTA